MEKYQGAFLIVAVCGIILLMLAVKSNSEMMINFVYRCVGGTLFIFLINQIVSLFGFSVMVGINLYTVLTSGILGFPGVLLLFGVQIYGIL